MGAGSAWLERRKSKSFASGAYFVFAAIGFGLAKAIYDPVDPLYNDGTAAAILALVGIAGALLLSDSRVSNNRLEGKEGYTSDLKDTYSSRYAIGHVLLTAAIVTICVGISDSDQGYNGDGVYVRLGLFALAAVGSLWSLWRDPSSLVTCTYPEDESPLLTRKPKNHYIGYQPPKATNTATATHKQTNSNNNNNHRSSDYDTNTSASTNSSYFWAAAAVVHHNNHNDSNHCRNSGGGTTCPSSGGGGGGSGGGS